MLAPDGKGDLKCVTFWSDYRQSPRQGRGQYLDAFCVFASITDPKLNKFWQIEEKTMEARELSLPRDLWPIHLEKIELDKGYDGGNSRIVILGVNVHYLDATGKKRSFFVSKNSGRATMSTSKQIEWVYSKSAGIEFTRSEVTVAQYRACVAAGECTHPSTKRYKKSCNWLHPDRDNHPINCVDLNQAKSFCEWAGGRLPSQDEWYLEASNGGERKYPWGDTVATCDFAVMHQGDFGCSRKSTWLVCSKSWGDSVSGLCDMSGNVSEWTSSWLDTSHRSRVLRGGSWNCGCYSLLAAVRSGHSPGIGHYADGIRCVRLSSRQKVSP